MQMLAHTKIMSCYLRTRVGFRRLMARRSITGARSLATRYRTLTVPSASHHSGNSDSLIIQLITAVRERRGCDILASVIAYLNWRITSARVPFISWRNQPSEVGCLTHAVNLCNQALHDPRPGVTQDEAAERSALQAELGALLEAAIAANAPKKTPQSQKLKARRATA